MARFIVLKDGQNHTVFDFDGNIARVGGGNNVDLNIDDNGIDSDLFYLTRTGESYEIEPRPDAGAMAINGAPVSGRTALSEGDKVTFRNYMIIVSYKGDQQPVSEPSSEVEIEAGEKPEMLMPEQKPASGKTKPLIETPQMVPPRQSVDKQIPPSPSGDVRKTTVLDLNNMSAPPSIQQTPPVQRMGGETAPIMQPEQPAQKPETPRKKKIEPVYSLVILTGYDKGRVRAIDTAKFIVGRDRSSDLVMDRNEFGQLDMSFSREHFLIASTDDGVYLSDMRSKLGTYLNGEVIEPGQRELISPEDEISVRAPSGEIVFRLCFLNEENFTPPSSNRKSKTKIVLILIIIVALLSLLLTYAYYNWI